MKIKYIKSTKTIEKEIIQAFKKVKNDEIRLAGESYALPFVFRIGGRDKELTKLLTYNYTNEVFENKTRLESKFKRFIEKSIAYQSDVIILYSKEEEKKFLENVAVQ